MEGTYTIFSPPLLLGFCVSIKAADSGSRVLCEYDISISEKVPKYYNTLCTYLGIDKEFEELSLAE
jgi:hypothetical protein